MATRARQRLLGTASPKPRTRIDKRTGKPFPVPAWQLARERKAHERRKRISSRGNVAAGAVPASANRLGGNRLGRTEHPYPDALSPPTLTMDRAFARTEQTKRTAPGD